ncbi:MAG: hypothetical protein QOD93_2596, partial [Acetobacteraceae bacterium]|nr:hypothetical protein [Acetobacteraceae bacterium]
PVNVRRSRDMQKCRRSAHQDEHDGQQHTWPMRPTETCSAAFSVRYDLSGAQVVHHTQKPFFPVRSRIIWCPGGILIQSRSAVHRARLLHAGLHPNPPLPHLRGSDLTRLTDKVRCPVLGGCPRRTASQTGGTLRARNRSPGRDRPALRSCCRGAINCKILGIQIARADS